MLPRAAEPTPDRFLADSRPSATTRPPEAPNHLGRPLPTDRSTPSPEKPVQHQPPRWLVFFAWRWPGLTGSRVLEWSGRVTLGLTPRQADLFRSTAGFCEGRVAPESIYGLLHRECQRLFPDEMFADLFTDVGRRCVPPMIVAVVMVLQRIEGLSATGRRWTGSASTRGGSTRRVGWISTIRGSCTRCWWTCARGWPPRRRPDRIFDTVLEVAKAAGLVGRQAGAGLDGVV